MNICRRCHIEGLVQGVFFRASTRNHAQQLGVTGWAANLPDGSVEVLACGSEEALEQLCDWLHKGPPQARVAKVHCKEETWQDISTFSTR